MTSRDTDEALLERVRKLLALATSPNLHEAAAAAAMAQRLIARHRLEGWLAAEQAAEADPDPITDGRDAPLEVARRLRKWKTVLATVLADANGCVAYTLDLGAEKAIALVGRERDRQAVAALWGFVVKRIEWLSATHGAGRPREWHEAFRVGAVETVAERLRQVDEEVRQELTGRELVVVDPLELARREAVDRWVGEHMSLGRGRGVRVDARAYRQGRQAGESLDLPGPADRRLTRGRR